MTGFQRKRIAQIRKSMEQQDSLIKKDADELLGKSRWVAAISLATLVMSVVIAIITLWRIFA